MAERIFKINYFAEKCLIALSEWNGKVKNHDCLRFDGEAINALNGREIISVSSSHSISGASSIR